MLTGIDISPLLRDDEVGSTDVEDQDRGVATDFRVGGRIVGRWLTYTQNTLKIGKVTGFGPLYFRFWGGTSPPKFVTGGDASPPSPPLSTPMDQDDQYDAAEAKELMHKFIM